MLLLIYAKLNLKAPVPKVKEASVSGIILPAKVEWSLLALNVIGPSVKVS